MPKGRKPRTISENNEIQKIKPMFYDLWKEKDNISMAELKILDVYMSAINSHNEETKEVIIDREHLNDVLGSHYTAEDLRTVFRKVLKLVIRVGENELISLFSMAKIQKDANSDYQVVLMCSEPAQEYFFNLDKIGYFSYKLKNTLAINSVYSYLMFNYLEMNRFRTAWEVSVDELKQILRCTDECYTKFKVFNDAILKKCFKELNENTSCKYSYETVKSGRHVQAIRFTLEPLNIEQPKIPKAEPIPTPQEEQTPVEKMVQSRLEFYNNAVDKNAELIEQARPLLKQRIISNGMSEQDAEGILFNAINDMALYQITQEVKYPIAFLTSAVDRYINTIKQQQAEQKPEPQEKQSYDTSKFDELAITHSKYGRMTFNTAEPQEQKPDQTTTPDAEQKKDAAIKSEKKEVTDAEVRAFIESLGKLD